MTPQELSTSTSRVLGNAKKDVPPPSPKPLFPNLQPKSKSQSKSKSKSIENDVTPPENNLSSDSPLSTPPDSLPASPIKGPTNTTAPDTHRTRKPRDPRFADSSRQVQVLDRNNQHIFPPSPSETTTPKATTKNASRIESPTFESRTVKPLLQSSSINLRSQSAIKKPWIEPPVIPSTMDIAYLPTGAHKRWESTARAEIFEGELVVNSKKVVDQMFRLFPEMEEIPVSRKVLQQKRKARGLVAAKELDVAEEE